MPNQAYMETKTGTPVFANNVGIGDRNKEFICCTNGCNAKMIICAPGTGKAYFRSKDKSDHINSDCIKNSIVFKPDKYDESLFDLNFAFESMLGLKHSKTVHRGTTGTKKGQVGNHRRIRMFTLPTIYAMCISKNKTDTYNKILIDDIFADDENFGRYGSGITGYKIVETSFYYSNAKEKSFMLNYPLDNRGISSWVKIKFEDASLYYDQVEKMKGSMHIEPFIVVGEWTLAPNGSKHHSECIIHKKSQIYYAEMK